MPGQRSNVCVLWRQPTVIPGQRSNALHRSTGRSRGRLMCHVTVCFLQQVSTSRGLRSRVVCYVMVCLVAALLEIELLEIALFQIALFQIALLENALPHFASLEIQNFIIFPWNVCDIASLEIALPEIAWSAIWPLATDDFLTQDCVCTLMQNPGGSRAQLL